MSIWSWLGSLFAPPPAQMIRPGDKPGTTVQLRWPRSLLPLDVHLEGGPESIFQSALLAVDYWNALFGRRLFREPIPAILEMTEAFQNPAKRPFLMGQILIRVDGSESDHGSTEEKYDERTGELRNAIVTLPWKSRRPIDVAKHELGHVLCLGHQDGGLMVAHLPPPGVLLPLASNQLKALKAMVG